MKRLFFSLILVGILSVFVSAQEAGGPRIAVDREIHEFGSMRPHEIPDGKLSFTVYNRGNEPLIVSNVRACCGTRVDAFPQAPISPGDSASVNVSWRIHNRPHRINRTVTITSNATNRAIYVLRINGEVLPPED